MHFVRLLKITILDNNLIVLHGPSFSGQFDLDDVGVKMDKQTKNIKLGFWTTKPTYFCFYIKLDEETRLADFFKQLGFNLYIDAWSFNYTQTS